MAESKGELSGQIPHCNFYFVALFLFKFLVSFSNCNMPGAFPIDFVAAGYQPHSLFPLPLKKSWIQPW